MQAKYWESPSGFKTIVAAYTGTGLIVALVIHAIVFASPIGDPTLKMVMANLGIHM
jgi:hypothetical protein